MSDQPQLAGSYARCRAVARAAARNFYYGFLLLPADKRDALCALYAFMRRADDIGDERAGIENKRRDLAGWRHALERTLSGDCDPGTPLAAFYDTVRRYAIPERYFYDLIAGVEMDLTVSSYETFEHLRRYCYCVAGTVGLSCLYVFGFRDPEAPDLAEKLGIAFQLTNILRDVAEDMKMGRLYVPQEDLARFGCDRAQLACGFVTPAFIELMRFEIRRARQFYEEGAALVRLVSPDSRAGLWALIQIYRGILDKIESRRYDVFSPPRPGLSSPEKLWILARGGLVWWNSRLCLPPT